MLDDVDFIVSKRLAPPSAEDYEQMLRILQRRQAIVLPAFEPNERLKAQIGVKMTIQAVHGGFRVCSFYLYMVGLGFWWWEMLTL
jgi:hypothetical protein